MENSDDVAVFDGVSSTKQFIRINHTMFEKKMLSLFVLSSIEVRRHIRNYFTKAFQMHAFYTYSRYRQAI